MRICILFIYFYNRNASWGELYVEIFTIWQVNRNREALGIILYSYIKKIPCLVLRRKPQHFLMFYMLQSWCETSHSTE